MTENEAKYEIIEHRPIIGFQKYAEALNVAILALEEIQAYRAIGTVEKIKALKEKNNQKKSSEHNYENCHNITCRRRCQKDGYNKAIDEFAEKFIFKAVCEGCSGCCGCYEEARQSECEDWKAYMKIAEQMKGGAE